MRPGGGSMDGGISAAANLIGFVMYVAARLAIYCASNSCSLASPSLGAPKVVMGLSF